MNISSATGRNPAVAAPMAAPTNADSLIGVSITRSPNLLHNPLVIPSGPAPGVHLAISATAAGNVFSHHDDRLVALHLLGQSFSYGLLEK